MTTQRIFPAEDWCIEPVGDRCIQVRVAREVGPLASNQVHAVARALQAAALPGVLDVVPAFTTVALFYRARDIRAGQGLAYKRLRTDVANLLAQGVAPLPDTGREICIPACYGGEYGPDLEEVAAHCGLSSRQVIELHSQTALTLYTFFFSPGNPFAGPLDERLTVPRRATPRTLVPAGSVAIANGISSIYQTTSPGGWNVIARTPWNLFDLRRDPPLRLQLGDKVRFEPISEAQFQAMLEERP